MLTDHNLLTHSSLVGYSYSNTENARVSVTRESRADKAEAATANLNYA